MCAQRKIICNKLSYTDQSTFLDSLRQMRTSGGAKQKAADKVMSIIAGIDLGMEIIAKMTNHGESRIEGCIKYDLPGACRLVTVETQGVIWLLYVGDHKQTDNWLENNIGWKPVSDKSRPNKIETIRQKVPQKEASISQGKVVTTENLPMFERFSFPEFDELIPQARLRRELLLIDESTDQDEIIEIVELIPDESIRELVFDILVLCREGNYRGAKARLKEYRGEAVNLLNVDSALNDAIDSGENTDTIIDFGKLTEKEIERLLDPKGFKNWMLYLHPDQQQMVDEDFDRPAVLKGVSGSGKTVVLLHRARRLAQKYPNETIGILTLNRSLAKLLRQLIDELCLNGENERIKVDAYYDYFQSTLRELGTEEYLKECIRTLPVNHSMQVALSTALKYHKNLANDFDPIGSESLDDTWREFWTDHVNDDHHTEQAKAQLIQKLKGDFDTETYIRDEFTLIRSAFSRDKRTSQYDDGYYHYERNGRCIPFNEVIRKNVLTLLLRYEEVMISGAMLDESGLAQVMMPHMAKLRKLPGHLQRRCLLIDEFQDFSTLELRLLKQIPSLQENGLFLTGDTVQKVLVKDFNLGVALLDRNYVRTKEIKKNYRNSRQILTAAHALIESYKSSATATDKSIEILNPEYAVRETAKPVAIQTNHQIEAAWQIADEWITQAELPAWSVCLVTCDVNKLPIKDIIAKRPKHINAAQLSGDYSEEQKTVSVGYLSDVKGLEFSVIIIVGATSKLVPAWGIPKNEQWRDALRFYVAMTRGRDQVVMTYENEPSAFLTRMSEHLNWQRLNVEEVKIAPVKAVIKKSDSVSKEIKLHPARKGKTIFTCSKITAAVLKNYFKREVYNGGGFMSAIKDQKNFDRAFFEWVSNVNNLKKINFNKLAKNKDDRNRAKAEISKHLEENS
jgi:superfamily I DNA/RNA helicase